MLAGGAQRQEYAERFVGRVAAASRRSASAAGVCAWKRLPIVELGAQRVPYPGHQAGGEQRCAAEVEERVVDADLVEPEDLGEEPGEGLLLEAARSPAAAPSRERRGGQRAPVELAVGAEREVVEDDDAPGTM